MGITQNDAALDRFFLIAPQLISLIQGFQDGYCTDNDHPTTKEHYQKLYFMNMQIVVARA